MLCQLDEFDSLRSVEALRVYQDLEDLNVILSLLNLCMFKTILANLN